MRLLARLLSPEHGRVLGFSLDEFGFSAGSGPWAAFLLAATRMRGCSPFNLVDLFWKTAGLGEGPRRYALREPGREERDKAAFLLRSQAPDHAKGYVGHADGRQRGPPPLARGLVRRRGPDPVGGALPVPGAGGAGRARRSWARATRRPGAAGT